MPAEFDYTPLVTDCIMGMLNKYNSGITQDQFYAMNIIDTTDVTESEMASVNQEVITFCKENGCYAALPPFEEGAFVDQTERRYIHWKVLDIQEDYFLIKFDHYPVIFAANDVLEKPYNIDVSIVERTCWYRAGSVTVKVKVVTDDEHMKMLEMHPEYLEFIKTHKNSPDVLRRLSAYLKTSCHVGGVLEDSTYYLSEDFKKILKKGKYYTSDGQFVNGTWVRDAINGTLEVATDFGWKSINYVSLGPVVEMFVYINYMLSQKSTSSSTVRHITPIYAPSSAFVETRKERHFGKLKVISEKKPRSVNATNIHRVYSAISWQRRSHLRHYKSGKIVPIKSAVCKRHNVETIPAPQVVYRA